MNENILKPGNTFLYKEVGVIKIISLYEQCGVDFVKYESIGIKKLLHVSEIVISYFESLIYNNELIPIEKEKYLLIREFYLKFESKFNKITRKEINDNYKLPKKDIFDYIATFDDWNNIILSFSGKIKVSESNIFINYFNKNEIRLYLLTNLNYFNRGHYKYYLISKRDFFRINKQLLKFRNKLELLLNNLIKDE